MAFNLAKDRFFGGGYAMYEPMTFAMYAPDPADVHAAHSIYFQAMGEHGFIGLGLYLLLGAFTWRSAAWIVRHSRGHTELQWAGALAAMIQASLIGFAVGGAFLSLLYWDVPYYLMAAIMTTRAVVQAHPGVRKSRLSQIRHPASVHASTVESAQIPRRRPEV
jgi:probable O-glycosylation ligase (exosortase A-associated)